MFGDHEGGVPATLVAGDEKLLLRLQVQLPRYLRVPVESCEAEVFLHADELLEVLRVGVVAAGLGELPFYGLACENKHAQIAPQPLLLPRNLLVGEALALLQQQQRTVERLGGHVRQFLHRGPQRRQRGVALHHLA